MIAYRTFRNADPPRILELWNRCSGTRGFGRPAGCDSLESLLFSRPYFDPKGLILAWQDRRLVGMAHSGFGCDEAQKQMDRTLGVICAILVDPDFRRQGIGSELLERSQEYLRSSGSLVQYAGAIHPLNPFYEGLYGGSEMPGFLESDATIHAFLQKRCYRPADTAFIYEQSLNDPPAIHDPRLPLLRRHVKLLIEPWPRPHSWWHAITFGSMISLRYEMVDRETDSFIGKAWIWEMEAFGRVRGAACVGITDVYVAENHRGAGFGKLLLYSILKHLQEQRIAVAEIQTMERNTIAQGLFQSVGFTRVDTGHVYRLDGQPPA